MSKRENPVDHVLDRMVEAVLGENAHFKSHADALGIPPDTIKTWKRRGAVPAGYLANFARDWKSSVDYLLHGKDGVVLIEAKPTPPGGAAQQIAQYGALADDERKLLENYRNSSAEVKEALQLVASIASRPQISARVAKPPRVKVRNGELPERKFDPERLKVMGGETPSKKPTRAGRKKGGGGGMA